MDLGCSYTLLVLHQYFYVWLSYEVIVNFDPYGLVYFVDFVHLCCSSRVVDLIVHMAHAKWVFQDDVR